MEINETKGILVDIKGIITFAKGYLVAEGGVTNEGITINYLMADNFAPCENSKDGSLGFKFSKSSLPVDRKHKLVAVPGYYNLKCEMGVGSDGKPVLKPIDVDLIKLCELKMVDVPKDAVDNADAKNIKK